MSTYYTTHPNLSVTALVDAPTTEKARTTFLDYLERRNLISRADRSYWRKNMVAERMDDPRDVQADVELYYGYQEGGQQMPPSMAAAPSGMADPREFEAPSSADMRELRNPSTEDDLREEMDAFEDYGSAQAATEPTPKPKLSPIAQVSLGRKE